MNNFKIEDFLVNDIKEKFCVSARKLHKSLGMSKKFNAWEKQNIKREDYNFKVDVDYINGHLQVPIGKGVATREENDFVLTLRCASHLAMVSKSKRGIEIRDYFFELVEEKDRIEKELEELKIKNIKAITMIFSHRDKLSLTYDSLYPILNELGVLNTKRSQVHNIIKKALIGKYENVRMDKAFNEADFIEDYKLLAEQMKEKYSGYFVDNNQVNWFDCLEV